MSSSKRAAPSLKDTTMAEVLIPCYGGPYDGQFFSDKRAPLGYRSFDVRGRMIYLWQTMKVERLDFNTLARASKQKPSAFDDHPEEEKK